MRVRKVIFRVVLIVVLLLVVSAVGLYIQISLDPAKYKPAHLTEQRRLDVSVTFVDELQDFFNKIEQVEPFTWTLTQERLNEYLASMDEIASDLPGSSKPGDVTKFMEKADLADPAVAMGDGVMALLIRSTEYDKVLSMDLEVWFPSEDELQIELTRARVGRLPMPDKTATRALRKLKRMIRWRMKSSQAGSSDDGPGGGGAGLSAGDMGGVLTTVVTAIDGSAIPAVFSIGNKRVRIADVKITPQQISLHFEPVGAKARPGRGADSTAKAGWPDGSNRR